MGLSGSLRGSCYNIGEMATATQAKAAKKPRKRAKTTTRPAVDGIPEVEPPTKDRRVRKEPGTRIKQAPGKKGLPVDWDVIEREYIGGFVEKNEKGQFERVWPTLREIESRYGIGLSTLNYQSTRRNWVDRRAEFQRELQRNFDEAIAKSRGSRLDEAARMLDTFVRKFETAIKKDAVPRASIADLERALKLRQWIDSERKAGAKTAGIELADLQRRHSEVKRFVEDMDPAMCGIIPGREDREAAIEAEIAGAKGDTSSVKRGPIEPPPLRRDTGMDRRSRWYQVEKLAEAALASPSP